MMHDIPTTQHDTRQGEIILYQPDETVRLEVRLEDDTDWLNRQQLAELFGRDVKTIGKHVNNALREELKNLPVIAKFATTARDGKTYQVEYYNLDMALSVGYRVKSSKGIQYRIWANKVIKDYLLRGYAINQQLKQMEQRIDARIDAHTQMDQKRFMQIEQTLADHQEKIDFFVRTNQPPVEGVFFEGQIFDAYRFVEALVKSAKREIVLIDNYVDATVFDLLEKRSQGVDATIYTEHVGQSLQHLQQLNQQYGRRIELREYNNRFHDRFLIIDDALYHFGASFKDLGRRLFAFELMGIDKSIILNQL
jgi:hypothetical protein